MVLLPGCGCCESCGGYPTPVSVEVTIQQIAPAGRYFWLKLNRVTSPGLEESAAVAYCLPSVAGTFSLAPGSIDGIVGFVYSSSAPAWAWSTISGPYNPVFTFSGTTVPDFYLYAATNRHQVRASIYERRAYMYQYATTGTPVVEPPTLAQIDDDAWGTTVQSLAGYQNLGYGGEPWVGEGLVRGREYCAGDTLFGSPAAARSYVAERGGNVDSLSWDPSCAVPLSFTWRVRDRYVFGGGWPNPTTVTTNLPAGAYTWDEPTGELVIDFNVSFSIDASELVYADGSRLPAFQSLPGVVCY